MMLGGHLTSLGHGFESSPATGSNEWLTCSDIWYTKLGLAGVRGCTYMWFDNNHT